MNFVSYLFVFGSIQALIFVLLLILKKGKNKGDRILLFWFLYFSLHLLFPAFVFYDYPANISYSGFDVGMIAIHVFFLESYISHFSNLKNRVAHFVKMLAFVLTGVLLYMAPIFIWGEEKRLEIMTAEEGFPLIMVLGALLLLVTGAYNLFKSFRKLQEFRSSLHQEESKTEGLTMGWVEILILIFILFYFLILLFFLLMIVTPIKPHIADSFVYGGLVFVLMWMGISAISQGEVFVSKLTTKESPAQSNEVKSPSEDDELLAHKIRQMVEEQKLYLNHDIRLSQLAQLNSISPQYLSFLLNSVLNETFYDFINRYRVEEVCSRIDRGEMHNVTLLSLAMNSGFNSKATFNRIFKKHKGINPSEYINNGLSL